MAPGAAALLQAIRGGYGGALLIAPGPVIRTVTGRPGGARTRAVARLLGARHLVQAVVTAATAASGESLGIGAAIDLVHAASMAGLAIADRRVRRLTLSDVLIETMFAATGLSLVTAPARTAGTRRGNARPPHFGRDRTVGGQHWASWRRSRNSGPRHGRRRQAWPSWSSVSAISWSSWTRLHGHRGRELCLS
jgi:hypothetical protein